MPTKYTWPWAVIGLFWTIVVFSFCAQEIQHGFKEAKKNAFLEARAGYNKDLVYRRWAAGHGGVYVPVTEETPPNKFLQHVAERDIETPSGKKLTLVNPAYMTRQVHELAAQKYGVKGHITSLNPLRPGNEPDTWEKEALKSFERGATSAETIEAINGEQFARIMFPMVTEERCLKCHAVQGYKAGDIRGGISATVPLAPYFSIAKANSFKQSLFHAFIWIVGTAGLLWSRSKIHWQAMSTETALHQAIEVQIELAESQARFKHLAESTQAVPWELNFQTNGFTYVGPQIVKLLGYPLDAWKTLDDWTNKIHPDDRERVVAFCKTETLEGKDHELYYRAIHADGRILWIQDIASVVIGESGPENIYGYFLDATKDRESEERQRLLFNHAGDAIYVSDLNGQLVQVNENACLSLGYSEEELLEKEILDVDAGVESIESLQLFLNDIKVSTPTKINTFHKRKDGTVFPVEIMLSRIETTRGSQIVGIARDLSQMSLDDKIQKTQIRLAENVSKHSVEELLQEILKESEVLTQSSIGFYHFVEDDQVNLTLQTWSENTLSNFCSTDLESRHYPISQAGVWTDCILEKKPVIHNDYESLPHKKGLPEGHAPVVRELVVPVVRQGQIVAILGVGNKAVNYTEEDARAVQKLADMVWEVVVRKQTEIKLQNSEERFKALHEASFGGSIIHEKGLILECNQGLSDMTGYSYEELIGMDGFKLIAPGSLDTVLRNVSSGYAERYEVEGVRKDGSVYPLAIRGKNSVYKGRDVRVIEFRDITEIEQAKKALIESEAKQRAMIENIHDVILVFDKNGVSQYISPNIEKWFGWKPQEIVNQSPWPRVHPDDLEQTQRHFAGMINSGIDLSGVELRYRCKDGQYVWVEVSSANCSDIPSINGYLVTFREISKRKRMQEEQRRSAQLAALGTVAAGVAHEINNPIQGIMNYAALIEKTPGNTARVTDIAQRIQSESDRIAKITEDLLYYSKGNAPKIVSCDVNDTVNKALSLVKTKLRSNGYCINADLSEELPVIEAYPQGLQQVVINLVDNAYDALRVKVSAVEEKTINIKTALVQKNDSAQVLIEVYDKGTGMSPEVVSRAKDAFYSTKPSSEGTGLGLSIVNDIINKHGGEFNIESVEGEYTRMQMFLPLPPLS